MKTKTASKPTPEIPHYLFGTKADFQALLDHMAARHAKFCRMSKAKQRADLIKRGVLTPEGKLPVYPMDHVPLGPRE